MLNLVVHIVYHWALKSDAVPLQKLLQGQCEVCGVTRAYWGKQKVEDSALVGCYVLSTDKYTPTFRKSVLFHLQGLVPHIILGQMRLLLFVYFTIHVLLHTHVLLYIYICTVTVTQVIELLYEFLTTIKTHTVF